ncbi:MAG: hypothetical protein N2652_02070 [Kiritimatiellae bacterium]|nr:hypothetical protein [Kiritimatiellia bacterium]
MISRARPALAVRAEIRWMTASPNLRRRRLAAVWGAGVVLAVAVFTPLVTPAGRIEPRLAAMPYTLWMGILVAAMFVGLTAAAARLCAEEDADGNGAPR